MRVMVIVPRSEGHRKGPPQRSAQDCGGKARDPRQNWAGANQGPRVRGVGGGRGPEGVGVGVCVPPLPPNPHSPRSSGAELLNRSPGGGHQRALRVRRPLLPRPGARTALHSPGGRGGAHTRRGRRGR